MTLDPFEALAGVRDFLSRNVLAVVPQEMAGEVRAAAKLLDDLADELDWLPAVLRAECEEMLDLLDKAHVLVGMSSVENDELRQKVGAPCGSIHEQIELHRDMKDAVCAVVPALQAQCRASAAGSAQPTKLGGLLDQFYALLGRQAETRLRWQSVFPGKQCRTSRINANTEQGECGK